MKPDTAIQSETRKTDPAGPLAGLSLEEAIHSTSLEILSAAVADPALSEDLALALLQRADLPPEVPEQLAKNSSVARLRKIRLALVTHPRTPRHISIPLVRHLYLFDLMQVALTPAVPADIKIAAEEALVARLQTVSVGEKLSLARRASGRVAEALLLDKDVAVMHAALENARLTEASIVKAVMRTGATAAFVDAVCKNSKWSVRHEVRVALLRNEKTSLACAIEFARALPKPQLRDILQRSRLSAPIKSALLKELAGRKGAEIDPT